MKIAMTGNRNKDLCKYIVDRLEAKGHECVCFSRETGVDFNDDGNIKKIVELVEDADIFINLYANFFFRQTLIAHNLWHYWSEQNEGHKRIINIGSTTDNVRRGKTNRYHYEKLALKEWSNGFSIAGVWSNEPKVTHLSIGTMENRSDDNPGRICLDMDLVASYVEWIIEQPKEININFLSVDPIQHDR